MRIDVTNYLVHTPNGVDATPEMIEALYSHPRLLGIKPGQISRPSEHALAHQLKEHGCLRVKLHNFPTELRA
mgnify:CR=1 FL=1